MKKNKNLQNITNLTETLQNLHKILVPEGMKNIIESQRILTESISKIDLTTIQFPKINLPIIEMPQRASFIDYEVLENLQKIGNSFKEITKNPELQFAFITDLGILNLKSSEELKNTLTSDVIESDILEQEELLNEHLIPYLARLELDSIWLGANYALDSKSNPDKLRHCLISLRTILEYLIDYKLAPKEQLLKSDKFRKEFKNYKLGKESIEYVRISRAKKIEYFTSKIEFGVLEDFTKKDIDFICNCYSILCNIHNPNIGINENQVRGLKVKTGMVFLQKRLQF